LLGAQRGGGGRGRAAGLPLGSSWPLHFKLQDLDRVKAVDDRVLQRWPTLRPYARLTFLVLE